MQASQESPVYEGMIAADPNIILSVMVPETVQKQAEDWQRGTRTLYQKAAYRFSGIYPADGSNCCCGEKHNLIPSCGKEKGDQRASVDKSTLQQKFWKNSLRPKNHLTRASSFLGKSISASSPQDLNKTQAEEIIQTTALIPSISHSDIHQSSKCRATKVSSRYRCHENLEHSGDHQPHNVENECTDDFSDFKSVSLQNLYGDATSGSTDFAEEDGTNSRCMFVDITAHRKDSTHTIHVKYNGDRRKENVKTTNSAPEECSGGLKRNSVCLTRKAFQGTESSIGCSAAREAFQNHQPTANPLGTKRLSQAAESSQNSMRVCYRQWMAQCKKMPASDSAVRDAPSSQTCYHAYKQKTVSRHKYIDPQESILSSWPDPKFGTLPHSNSKIDPVALTQLNEDHDDVIMGLCDAVQTSGSDDLVDLSVEDTVEFFLNMTSPLRDESIENLMNSTEMPPYFETNYWGVHQETFHF